MRDAWVAAAAICVGAVACSSSRAPLEPASVPCGFRAIVYVPVALSVPLFWSLQSTKNDPRALPTETTLLVADGGAAAVVVTSDPWSGSGHEWALEFVTRLKQAHFELVQHRWLSVAGEDALLVEHRSYDSRRKIEWHDWRLLAVGRGRGFQLMCRIDEDDIRVLRPVCTSIAESFVVMR